MRKKILSLIIFLAIFGIVSTVSALETTWPPSPFETNLTDDSNLTDLVRYIYEWGIFLGGIAVFISLLIGGFLYLTSAGDPGRMTEAKDRIFTALIGLVLLFSIYLILNTINPELTVLTLPETGIISCDVDADCQTSYECKNDPSPGDGVAEGTCIIIVPTASRCDTAPADCPGPTCDCPGGYECGGDPSPGDGVAEGICILGVEEPTRCDVDADCPVGQECSGGDPTTAELEGVCVTI